MKKSQPSVYEVQEFHRGKWIAVLSKDEKGKEVKKTVKISEDTAAIMNIDAEADMSSKAKRTKHFRYVLSESNLPSYSEQKEILKEAGVEFKMNAKKEDLLDIYNNYVSNLTVK